MMSESFSDSSEDIFNGEHTPDHFLILFRDQVVAYITDSILAQEKRIYDLLQTKFPEQIDDILFTNRNSTYMKMIKETKEFIYNDLYRSPSNKICELQKLSNYSLHILLTMIFTTEVKIHFNLNRNIFVNCFDSDTYLQLILTEINRYVAETDLLPFLQHPDDDILFPEESIPKEQKLFEVVFDFGNNKDNI